MEESLYDRLYAKLCETVHTKKDEEEPTFLRRLMNLACFILVLGALMSVGIIIDCILRISQEKDLPTQEKQITIELI